MISQTNMEDMGVENKFSPFSCNIVMIKLRNFLHAAPKYDWLKTLQVWRKSALDISAFSMLSQCPNMLVCKTVRTESMYDTSSQENQVFSECVSDAKLFK